MKYTQKRLVNFSKLDLGSGFDLQLDSDLGERSACLLRPKTSMFLGRFTSDDLLNIMEKTGLVAALKQLEFDDLHVHTDMDEARVYYMKLYGGKPNPENMLIDLRVAETRFMPNKRFFPKAELIPAYDMVVIEWLSLQNPRIDDFASDRPQLPGQTKPGLGILKYCFEMMFEVAKRISKDGFLDMPEYIHAAIMYARKFQFFDPLYEAMIRAMLRDLSSYSMSDLSWGMITKTIIDENTGEPEIYTPSEQIYYASDRMKKYFQSDGYKSAFKKAYRKKKYRFDYQKMIKIRTEILKTKSISDV
ncbi:MAG: hypothetical protein FWG92_06230 [Leptospirales bacterium]|nr:hypothetical protein [Leptospirales bacterium]